MNLAQKDLKYIWHPCSQMKDYETFPPIIVERAQGVNLYDTDGNKYLDVISSWWCNLLGHSNPRINQAVKEQLDKLEHVIFANFSHEPAILLCEKLSALTPPGLEKLFFTDNGSSAIEAALKMSFQYHYQTGNPAKKKFIALSGAYHGETLGALSVGGVDLYSKLYQPLLLDVIRVESPDCYRCPYEKDRATCGAECFAVMEEAFAQHGEEACAVIIEPLVQAAAGMRIYSPLYLKKLRTLCDTYNTHLITDEIATGYGRTGRMFACEHAAISPDIMCLSKGLTGGYLPMALAVTTNKIYDAFYADYSTGKAFLHSHTYAGNPLACAAALEVLNIFAEEGILTQAQEKAAYFKNLVTETFAELKWVGDLRQIGLINAIELVENKKEKKPFPAQHRYGYQIYRQALNKGLLLRPLGDVLYFNPPLIIEKDEMDFAARTAAASIRAVLG
jgi:adenosylmethionine-8-amino-7-oxononanoate aminotransferase